MQTRRQFLTRTALPLLATTALAACTRGGVAQQATKPAAPTVIARRKFAHAISRDPRLASYADPVPALLDGSSMTIEHGAFPPDLVGAKIFRNGPAQRTYGQEQFTHFFDGDGLIQRFTVTDAKSVQHVGKFVNTARRQAETKANAILYPGFGTPVQQTLPIYGADTINQANISMLAHHNRLFALWEGGSPHEIDADTLATKGIGGVGLSATAFTAHPKKLPSGWVYGFGYDLYPSRITLFAIDPMGNTVRHKEFAASSEVAGTAPLVPMHDFVVTEKYIVLVAPPFHFSGETQTIATRIEQEFGNGAALNAQGAFVDQFQWNETKATKVTVFDRETLEPLFHTETDPFWVFHFANGYDDKDTIIFDAPIYQDTKFMTETAVDLTFGRLPEDNAPTTMTRFTINVTRKTMATSPLLPNTHAVEFPQIHPASAARHHNQTIALTQDKPGIFFNSILSYTGAGEDALQIPLGDTVQLDEAIIVPKNYGNDPTQGYVLVSGLDTKTQQGLLFCLDGARLQEGPLARATTPYPIPASLHGTYVF